MGRAIALLVAALLIPWAALVGETGILSAMSTEELT